MNKSQLYYFGIVFILLGLMMTAAVANLQYSLNVKSPSCGGCTFYSFHADLNNFAIFRKLGTNKISFGFKDSLYVSASIKVTFTPFNSFQIKTSSLNVDPTTSVYLIFNSTFVFEYPSLQGIYTVIPLQSIVDSVFGETLKEVFVLTKLSNITSHYRLKHFRNGGLTLDFQLTVLGITPLARMVYGNGYVFLHFETEVQVLAFNGSYTQVYNHNYKSSFANLTDFSKVDLDVQQGGTAFCYTTPTTLFLVTIPNFVATQLNFINDLSLSVTDIVIGARYALLRYILLTTNSTIYQYDILLNKIINSTSLTPAGNFTSFSVNVNQSVGLIFFIPRTSSFLTMYQFNVTSEYYCENDGSTPGGNHSCVTCLDKYVLNNQLKHCYIPILSEPVQHYTQTQPSNDALNTFSTVLGQALSLSSLRITPKFLLAFICFLDDLWFYQYHHKKYPVAVTYAFANVDIANDIRFNSWVTSIVRDMTQKIQNNDDFFNQNQQYQNELGFSDTDPDVYFSYSSRQFYRFNILQSILLYCVLKLLQLIFRELRTKSRLFAEFYLVLKNRTKWWTILVTLIESNVVRLTFYNFLQFKLPINYNFSCKVNLIANILVLFVLIFYSSCFYLLVYAWESFKQPAEQLLTRSIYCFNSFLLQPCYLIARGLVRAAIHGFFIQNYQLQIALLFFVDLLSIPFVFIVRKCFVSRYTFAFTLCYSVAFAVFDLYFLIESNPNFQSSLSNNRETMGLIFICLLFGFTVLIALSILVFSICPLFKLIREKFITNDIAPSNYSRSTIKMKAFIIKALGKKDLPSFSRSASVKSPPESRLNAEPIKTIKKSSLLVNNLKMTVNMRNLIKQTHQSRGKIKISKRIK